MHTNFIGVYQDAFVVILQFCVLHEEGCLLELAMLLPAMRSFSWI